MKANNNNNNIDPQLPPDLAQLEQSLLHRPAPTLPLNLRDRIISTINIQLSPKNSALTSSPRPLPWWQYAASLAAMFLALANLSAATSTAPYIYSPPQRPPFPQEIAATAQLIQQLLPDITEKEARRQALLMFTARNIHLTPTPNLKNYKPFSSYQTQEQTQ